MDGNQESTNPGAGRRLILLLAILVVVLAAILTVLKVFFAGSLPQIGPGDLTGAREKWASSGPADYRLTVVISGRQSGELKVEVRGGRPVGMTRNGTAMKAERTWEPWTVPGMFETLETDFDNAAHADEKFDGGEVVMRCEFDSQYGFPKHYLHQILGRHGDLEWTVTEFTPL
jgi:hypothetical protein